MKLLVVGSRPESERKVGVPNSIIFNLIFLIIGEAKH